MIIKKKFLLIGLHLRNGSPENPAGQLHIGLWLMTWHCAWIPQVPTHGFTHFKLLHASFLEQSELTTHSGLQDGGLPM